MYDDLKERLRKPIDASAIYAHMAKLRKQTTSDLPWLSFANEMELIDEERAQSAAAIEDLERRLAEAVANEREACAKVCEDQQKVFASAQYAAGQPMSSFGERFACGQCAAAIRERT